MKRLLSIGFTLFSFVLNSFQILLAQDCNCTYTLENDSNVLINVFDSKNFDYKPGNIFCLKSGNWSGVRFLGFNGTVKQPIIFKNIEGRVIIESKVGEGIKFVDCENFSLKGNGESTDSFGIHISTTDENYEAVKLEHVGGVEISRLALSGIGKGMGIYLSGGYSSQKRYTVNLHNNKFANFRENGISITASSSVFMSNNELGKKKLKARIFIKNNQLKDLGCQAIYGDPVNASYKIIGNSIVSDQTVNEKDSIRTVVIENARSALIHNNKIVSNRNNAGENFAGIYVKNVSNHLEIYNNLLVNLGMEGIVIAPKLVNSKDWKGYYAINNTIIGSAKTGIHFVACAHSIGKEDCNHEVAYGFYNNLIIKPNFLDTLPYDFIKMTGWHKDPVLKESNNYFAASFEGLGLKDTIVGDFQLAENSPLINAGKQVGQFDIMNDIDGNPRPAGGFYDIGCYEYKRVIPKNKSPKELLEVMAFPNFENNKLILINTSSNETNNVAVGVYNSLSQKLDEICLNPNLNEIDMQQYNNGIYYIVIRTLGTLQTLRFVKC